MGHEPVTINLQNVTLRSALRLMLKNLQLTYIIQDEVLMITTPQDAETHLVVKVYPVADLVLPIECDHGLEAAAAASAAATVAAAQGGGGGGFGGGGGGFRRWRRRRPGRRRRWFLQRP